MSTKSFAEKHDIHATKKGRTARVRKVSKMSNGSDGSDTPSTSLPAKAKGKKSTDTKAKIKNGNIAKASSAAIATTSSTTTQVPKKSPQKTPKKNASPTPIKSPKKATASIPSDENDANDGNDENNGEWPSPINDYIKQFKTKAGIRDESALSFRPSINSTNQNELTAHKSPKKAANENRKRALHDEDIGGGSDTPHKQSKSESTGVMNGQIEKIKFNDFTYVVKKIGENRTKWECNRKVRVQPFNSDLFTFPNNLIIILLISLTGC